VSGQVAWFKLGHSHVASRFQRVGFARHVENVTPQAPVAWNWPNSNQAGQVENLTYSRIMHGDLVLDRAVVAASRANE